LEWALIGIAVLALAQVSRFDLIPQALGVIVGLHYLPLGKILTLWVSCVAILCWISSVVGEKKPETENYARN
jgi:hypothetical protein